MDGFSIEGAVRGVIRKVYGWMALGLATTASVAYFVSNSPSFYRVFFKSPGLPLVLFICQLALVIVLTAGIRRMNFGTALAIFFAYAALTGVTFSAIF